MGKTVAQSVVSLLVAALWLIAATPNLTPQIIPTIENASINTMNNTITINGGGFNPSARPVVSSGRNNSRRSVV